MAWGTSLKNNLISLARGAAQFGSVLAQGRVGLVCSVLLLVLLLQEMFMVFPLHHHHLDVLLQAKQSLATLTKDVPKRHSLAMPGETVLNGNQEWVMQADLPLTAAIRQSQQTLYHSHPQHSADRQGGHPVDRDTGEFSGPNPFWGGKKLVETTPPRYVYGSASEALLVLTLCFPPAFQRSE